jgi:hypothetical protein
MPSPFPGMDPFLEDPAFFPSFHALFISEIVAALQPALLDRGYHASVGTRVWFVEPEVAIYPDVSVLARGPTIDEPREAATAVIDPPVRVSKGAVENRERFVEIRELTGRRLVTAIECISPSNKSSLNGRELYRRKQRETEAAGVHLVEIDLLRKGPRIADIPEAVLLRSGAFDYLINIARRGSGEFEFYPLRLADRLPRIGVPLLPDADDAPLDLGAVFARTFEVGGFRAVVDYFSPRMADIPTHDVPWAQERIDAAMQAWKRMS